MYPLLLILTKKKKISQVCFLLSHVTTYELPEGKHPTDQASLQCILSTVILQMGKSAHGSLFLKMLNFFPIAYNFISYTQ